jgi:phage-related protein
MVCGSKSGARFIRDGDEVVLMKDCAGRVIGFEKLNFTTLDPDQLRLPYITVQAPRVCVLRVFVKKTEKTPKSEIELALKRAKELKK